MREFCLCTPGRVHCVFTCAVCVRQFAKVAATVTRLPAGYGHSCCFKALLTLRIVVPLNSCHSREGQLPSCVFLQFASPRVWMRLNTSSCVHWPFGDLLCRRPFQIHCLFFPSAFSFLICKNSLYILHPSLLSSICFATIFSQLFTLSS